MRKSKRDFRNELSNSTYRVPKQLTHWLRRLGLNPSGRDRYPFTELKGRGRYWRINCDGIFEPSCAFEDFDRWANSNPLCGFDIAYHAGFELSFRIAFLNALDDARAQDHCFRGRFDEGAGDTRFALAP